MIESLESVVGFPFFSDASVGDQETDVSFGLRRTGLLST